MPGTQVFGLSAANYRWTDGYCGGFFSWEGDHAGRKVREQDWAGHVLHCKAHGPLAL